MSMRVEISHSSNGSFPQASSDAISYQLLSSRVQGKKPSRWGRREKRWGVRDWQICEWMHEAVTSFPSNNDMPISVQLDSMLSLKSEGTYMREEKRKDGMGPFHRLWCRVSTVINVKGLGLNIP